MKGEHNKGEDFMFELTKKEALRCQFGTSNTTLLDKLSNRGIRYDLTHSASEDIKKWNVA